MIEFEKANELLRYHPESGNLIWTKGVKGSKGIGNIAGTLAHNGYIDVCLYGKKYGAHRLAFLLMTQKIPRCVDHINGIKSDNRWCNLRPATYSQNGFNYKGTGSTTGLKNVYMDKRYPDNFFVQLRVNGKTLRLGTFKTAEEANEAAIKGRIQYCGEFVNHG